jgi:hypothetical protein
MGQCEGKMYEKIGPNTKKAFLDARIVLDRMQELPAVCVTGQATFFRSQSYDL